ncbi:MAG: phosphate ABC transporter permease PstA [Gemmataceae bacterium]
MSQPNPPEPNGENAPGQEPQTNIQPDGGGPGSSSQIQGGPTRPSLGGPGFWGLEKEPSKLLRSVTGAFYCTLVAWGVVLVLVVVQCLITQEMISAGAIVGVVGTFVVFYAFLFAGHMVWFHRPTMDKAFAWVGFFATFFGLAALALLFFQLTFDAINWFSQTPRFVHKRNVELLTTTRQIATPQRFVANKLEEVNTELDNDLQRLPKMIREYKAAIKTLKSKRSKTKSALEAGVETTKEELESELQAIESELASTAEKLQRSTDVLALIHTQREEILETKRDDFERMAKELRTEVRRDMRPNRLTTARYEELVEKVKPSVLSDQEFKELVERLREGQDPQGYLPNPTGWTVLWYYLTHGTSNEPQDAGIYPALMGSFWIALITMLFAVPVGVGAALYLEEYKTTGWFGKLIQVNINNLAGVPSVVYGILGAYVFVELIFKPLANWNSAIAARNLLGGGLTLGLLTLPVVIVAAQEAIRAVPKSIREGAIALGATKWQTIWLQVLPVARPGILTGTILSISRAIGEAAPLVLFGALLFVRQYPTPLGRFTILPMQIFNWAGRPPIEGIPLWRYNAAMSSIVLLLLLIGLNSIAIYMRNRTQKRVR